MKRFSNFLVEEDTIAANKKRLQTMHKQAKSKGGQVHVTYTDQKTGEKKTGRYGGMMNMGGRSYAKIHHKDHMTTLPLHHPHDVKHVNEDVEQVDELSRKTLASYTSKASDARGHRNLPVKKVDNRYAGVAKASKKIDKMNEASESAMRDWVYRHLENSDMTHGEMKQEFIKKYGAGNAKIFDKYVSQYMD